MTTKQRMIMMQRMTDTDRTKRMQRMVIMKRMTDVKELK